MNKYIQLEYFEDELDLVFKKPVTATKQPPKEPTPIKPEPEKISIPKENEISVEQLAIESIASINQTYSEYQTLMPYTCTLILNDVSLKRHTSFQIIAKIVGEQVDDLKMIVFRPSSTIKVKNPIEVIDFGTNRMEAVRKFHDMFFEMTYNNFEERNNFVENPGKYFLSRSFEFILHGEKVPTFSEEKNQFLSKAKFVSLKLTAFEQLHKDKKELVFEKLLNISNLYSFIKTLQISEDLFFKITNSKLISIWHLIGILSKELKSKNIRKVLVEENLHELNFLIFENNLAAYFCVSTFFELVEIAKKIRLLSDSLQYTNFMLDLYNLLSSQESFDLFLSNSRIDTHKIDKSSPTFEFVTNLFVNSFANIQNNMKLAIESVFQLNFKNCERRFYPFEKFEKVYLWKAFEYISFAAFLNNKSFVYADEPNDLSSFGPSGISFFDCSSKAIQNLPFYETNKYFLVLFEVAVLEMKEIKNLEMSVIPSIANPMMKICGKWDASLEKNEDGILFCKTLCQRDVSSPFAFNEYIVYDTNQYVPRFVLSFK